jgi:hypothetical protein
VCVDVGVCGGNVVGWLVVGGWVGGWWVVRSNSNSTQLSVRIHCVLYYCCWLVGSLLSVSVVSFLFPYISHTYTHTCVCVCVVALLFTLCLCLSLLRERETHTRLRMDNMAVQPDRLVGFVHGIKHLQLSLFTSSSSQMMMIYINRDCNGCKCGHVSRIFCCC